MKQLLVMGLLLSCACTVFAQENLWDEVARFEEQSLPKSALTTVDRIEQNAMRQGDYAEAIKAMIYRLKYQTAIDADSLPERIAAVEQFAAQCTDIPAQALLYSLTAELYLKYYQARRYTINQRTELLTPPNALPLREWTRTQFVSKIDSLTKASLHAVDILKKTDILQFQTVVQTGEASRLLRPTLLDFLYARNIDLLKTWNDATARKTMDTWYQAWQTQQQPHSQAALMIALDALQFRADEAPDDYLSALQQLEQEYVEYDYCTEILYAEASWIFTRKPYQSNDVEGKDTAARRAYELCREGLRRYPNYERAGILRNLLHQITDSHLNIVADNSVYPGDSLKLKISYQNINRLTVDIYRISTSVTNYANNWTRNGKYKVFGKRIQSLQVDLINDYPYLESDTTIAVQMLNLGNYEYVVRADDNTQEPANQQFSVSRLATVARTLEGKREFLVVDKHSGKPIEGAQIHFYTRKSNSQQLVRLQSITTNALGLAQSEVNQNWVFYNATIGSDTALLTTSTPWAAPYSEDNAERRSISLFTDRSIYRPGQIVSYKGIIVSVGVNRQTVVANQDCEITFRDANYEEISRQKVKSNEYGSFSGEFVIPQNRLNGNFSLTAESRNITGVVSISVEAYKRPSFLIRIDTPDKSYGFGDTVVFSGTAQTYSGVNIQAAEVSYRIIRNARWFFRPVNPSEQVAHGQVQTDAEGRFTIPFTPVKTAKDKQFRDVLYNYTLEVSLTDSKGETQSANMHLTCGDQSMYLMFSALPDVIDKTQPLAMKIQANNLSQSKLAISIDYSLQNEQKQTVASGKVMSDSLLQLSCTDFPSGKYTLIAKATDDQGRPVEKQTEFILASTQDKRPPTETEVWLMTPKTVCKVGEQAEIIFGSSKKDVSVLYELFRGNQRISVSRFALNNSNRRLKIPFLESYKQGVSASFSFVKDGKFYNRTVNIIRQQEDKQLQIKTEVFRDKILPGAQETWKISVKDANNKALPSEVLAAMYDASLDAIQAHQFSFQPVFGISLWNIYNQEGNAFGDSRQYYNNSTDRTETTPTFIYDRLNWFGFEPNIYERNVLMKSSARRNGALAVMEEAASADLLYMQEAPVSHFSMQESGFAEDTAIVGSKVQIRENFNETAFFYPHLLTDSSGTAVITFTVPESNTTWNFMGVAHTKDLHYGSFSQQAISQKPLMVSPNLPRFLRQGDTISLSANVSNLAEEALSGDILLECFDPENEKENIVVPAAAQRFYVEKGQTVTLVWILAVPDNISMTGVRIVAQSTPMPCEDGSGKRSFSDGEQHLVPILPRKTAVTEATPFIVRGGETKTLTTTYPADARLTLELTSNPIWYAIQALPSLQQPQSDNAVAWFAALYSNMLATKIANSTPKIKQIVQLWNEQHGDKETLLSQLEKNEALKSVVLEETPWVMDAKTESEQRQRLALLFDLNRATNFNTQAWDKLCSLQTSDGGWAWFQGMNSNESITQWMLYGLRSMQDLKNYAQITASAVQFIDRRFLTCYKNFKKHFPNQTPTLSAYEIEYLFVRSYYSNVPIDTETQTAITFYTQTLAKDWAKTSNLYLRALTAMLMHRNGNSAVAQAIIKSLREHATAKADVGMYWANNHVRCFLSQSAVSVHTYLMQAFRTVGASTAEIDEMKLWLLQQKQTQVWESVPASIDAIDVLTASGSAWLNESEPATVIWNGAPIETSLESGTGYFKTPLPVSDQQQLRITQHNSVAAFGAVYAQYFENLNQQKAASISDLSIKKELFVEEITAQGKILRAISPQQPLQTGDKITVRLSVTTGRDLEYVHVKDLRAAGCEPVDRLSGMQWKQNVVYYQSAGDAASNFFLPILPRGTYVFEYSLYANAKGSFTTGTATVQCLYAPEFTAHTEGTSLVIR
ncbi:MAG: hypothetical protein LBR66_02820 [Candidatus Symbiothrix sp.]|jgi:uncharacterized protein YfaS (alpha-2-macroglobulin family)|nr:hypothetical protein [Candidatus Symbiothrix sp.]